MLTLLMASCTLVWASAILERATSWSRLVLSSSSLLPMAWRPLLSFSTTTVCCSMDGPRSLLCSSYMIWRLSATRARFSKRPASAASAALSSLAFAAAAAALAPHSAAVSSASRLSASIMRRLPMVWATASSASAMLPV